MHRVYTIVFAAVLVLGAQASAADSPPGQYQWQLPAGFPIPEVPADNPMSEQKVQLGQRLFNDVRLSVNDTTSCATCHQSELYFTDGKSLAIGALKQNLKFNTPTLLNSAYGSSFGWTDQALTSLEEQHLLPLTNQVPTEMGFSDVQLQTLNADRSLVSEFRDAFGDSFTTITIDQVIKALASYVRTLVATSPIDDYLYFDRSAAISESAHRGLALFTSERLGCSQCHAGFLFSGPVKTQKFHQPPSFQITTEANQAFKVPSLRFVAHTAPYMHDGRFESLIEVLDFYAHADTGAGSVTLHLKPFTLTKTERNELIEFLEQL